MSCLQDSKEKAATAGKWKEVLKFEYSGSRQGFSMARLWMLLLAAALLAPKRKFVGR
jgi:hypothetical protein